MSERLRNKQRLNILAQRISTKFNRCVTEWEGTEEEREALYVAKLHCMDWIGKMEREIGYRRICDECCAFDSRYFAGSDSSDDDSASEKG